MRTWLLALGPHLHLCDREFWHTALKDQFAAHVAAADSAVVGTVARALRGEGDAIPAMLLRALAAAAPSECIACRSRACVTRASQRRQVVLDSMVCGGAMY